MYLSTECHFSNQGYYTGSKKSVFLAGPTERNSKYGTKWRYEVRKILNDLPDLVLFIPEPADLSNNPDVDIRPFWPDFNTQVDWEHRHMEVADVIAFWVPRNMANLPGLTTNVEFGFCMGLDKCIYGRPDDAEHIRYLDYCWEATEHINYPICSSIEDLCYSIIRKMKKNESIRNSD